MSYALHHGFYGASCLKPRRARECGGDLIGGNASEGTAEANQTKKGQNYTRQPAEVLIQRKNGRVNSHQIWGRRGQEQKLKIMFWKVGGEVHKTSLVLRFNSGRGRLRSCG